MPYCTKYPSGTVINREKNIGGMKMNIECSENDIVFRQMRICNLYEAAVEIQFGIYACSPEYSSFRAILNMTQYFSLSIQYWF